MLSKTIDQWEAEIGERLKEARLAMNLSQSELASRAGISRAALTNIEGGGGSSLKSFIAVVKALGHETWLGTVAPVSLDPFLMVEQRPRQRARKRASHGD